MMTPTSWYVIYFLNKIGTVLRNNPIGRPYCKIGEVKFFIPGKHRAQSEEPFAECLQ